MLADFNATDRYKTYDFKQNNLLNFKRSDSDLIVVKLLVLTRNERVALPYPTFALLCRIAPSSVVCRSVCHSISLSH